LQEGLSEVKVSADKDTTTLRKDLEAEVIKLASLVKDGMDNLNSSLFQKEAVHHNFSKHFHDLDLKISDLENKLETSKNGLEKKLKESESKMANEAIDTMLQLSSLATNLTLTQGNLTLTQGLLEERLQKVKEETLQRRGSSYIRWGRTDCPDDDQLVYKGKQVQTPS
jgi:hypothetical protein